MQQTPHHHRRKTERPPLDIPLHEHDLPVLHDSRPRISPPPPPTAQTGTDWQTTVLFLLPPLVGMPLDGIHPFSMVQVCAVMYGLVGILWYWVAPRPPQSFLSWILKIIGVWLNFYVALVTIPQLLRVHLPEQLAFTLPALVGLLIFAWLPPLKPNYPQTSRWQQVLSALTLAYFWGTIGPSFF